MKVIRNSFAQDNIIRTDLVRSISIYSNRYIYDHVNNIETLKLFAKIDIAYKIGNKKLFFESFEDFIKNENGKFNSDYGKSKDHLESLIKYNNNLKFNELKISTHELFSEMGVSEKIISSLGITKTSKTDIVTKFFEFLTSEAIKNKYIYVKDVIICAPGKIKVPYFNGTKQPNFDLLIEIENFNGEKIYIAFDHKVKDLESCIKEIKNNGFKYNIYTLGDVQDHTFYESPAVKESLSHHDYTEVENFYQKNSSLINETIIKSEITNLVSSKDLPSSLSEKVLSSIDRYEQTKDISIINRTPLIPLMLVSNQDLVKALANLNKNRIPNGIDFSNNDFS